MENILRGHDFNFELNKSSRQESSQVSTTGHYIEKWLYGSIN